MLDYLVKNTENFLQTAIIVFAVLFVRFLIGAIGLFLVAKKRDAKAPFLAFLPVVYPLTLGSLADKANIKRGKKTNSATTLLVLSILKTVAYTAFIVTTAFSLSAIITAASDAVANGTTMTADMFKSAIFVVATYLVALILAIFYVVYYYISLFRVYKREMSTGLAVVSLILSLFVSPAKEIILLVLGIVIKEEKGFTIE